MVARLVVLQDGFVAVGDIATDAGAGGAAPQLPELLDGAERDVALVLLGAQAGVVCGDLLGGVDGALRPGSGRAEQLVDVAEILVRLQAALLAGAVREDDD